MDFIEDFTGQSRINISPSSQCSCSEPPLCHQPARGLLKEWIEDEEKFLNLLKGLEEKFPMNLPPEAEEALWQILNRARRANRGTSSIF